PPPSATNWRQVRRINRPQWPQLPRYGRLIREERDNLPPFGRLIREERDNLPPFGRSIRTRTAPWRAPTRYNRPSGGLPCRQLRAGALCVATRSDEPVGSARFFSVAGSAWISGCRLRGWLRPKRIWKPSSRSARAARAAL